MNQPDLTGNPPAAHRDSRGSRAIGAWLDAMQRYAWLVLLGAIVATGISLRYAATHLGVNNNTVEMLDERLPFRIQHDRLRTEFPITEDSMMLVIEAPTPEQASMGAAKVEAALAAMPEAVEQVFWPAGNDFLQTHGLLLRSPAELESMADTLGRAQPLLAQLAAEPTVPTFLDLIAEAERRRDEVEFDTGFLKDALTRTIQSTLEPAGDAAPMSWQQLLSANAPTDTVSRETIIIKPRLADGKVNAAKPAMLALQEMRRELGLSDGPVQLRISGAAALKFEELESVVTGARLTGFGALLLVTLIMVTGLKSWRFILCALASLLLGLSVTAAFAGAAIGRVNLISVAFVVLYVGLGVNYAVHYLLRCRELTEAGIDDRDAVHHAGVHLAGALLLSALTTAIGFFAFTPTAFKGVAELGLIAGFAMFVTLIVSYTLTPALLTITGLPRVRARRSPESVNTGRGLLALPLRQRSLVLGAAAALGLFGLVVAPKVVFDSDPLNLRDPRSESVKTMRALLADGQSGYRNIQVLVPADEALEPLLEKLTALPEVARTNSLQDLTVVDAEDKLAIVDELYYLLGGDILDADWEPSTASPAALKNAIDELRSALDPDAATDLPLAAALARLEDALDGSSSADLAERLTNNLLGLLPVTMQRLSRALSVTESFALADLPTDLLAFTLSASGTRLVQVVPAGDMDDFRAQNQFAEAVAATVPTATGAPIIQLAAGQAITDAFVSAVVWALAGITLVLLVLLRSLIDTLRVLLPLMLGGVLTLAFMVLAGIDFNFANVVALPLLLGVGVDNGIHLVLRWRQGALPAGNVLATATARAIVLGSLITAGGFGNLALSPHQGTASMGVILAVGLALVVGATLLVLPALLGPERASSDPAVKTDTTPHAGTDRDGV